MKNKNLKLTDKMEQTIAEFFKIVRTAETKSGSQHNDKFIMVFFSERLFILFNVNIGG